MIIIYLINYICDNNFIIYFIFYEKEREREREMLEIWLKFFSYKFRISTVFKDDSSPLWYSKTANSNLISYFHACDSINSSRDMVLKKQNVSHPIFSKCKVSLRKSFISLLIGKRSIGIILSTIAHLAKKDCKQKFFRTIFEFRLWYKKCIHILFPDFFFRFRKIF